MTERGDGGLSGAVAAALLLVCAATGLSGCDRGESPARPTDAGDDVAALLGEEAEADGYDRATGPRPFRFPDDHGPHPNFKHEWWYYTGNLTSRSGRPFGFQLTFFRIAIAPTAPRRRSAWATHQVYMAHFAVTDIGGGNFHSMQRLARGALGLAGSQGDPFRVWLNDWHAQATGTEPFRQRLRAADGNVALDLVVRQTRPAVLQGVDGLSQKSAEPGNASYYYSLTRMVADGSITIAGERYDVQGLAWMDREWGTSALGPDQEGWDWFALQLGDGSELMFYRLRRRNGDTDPFSAGTLRRSEGDVVRLTPEDIQIRVLDQWRSPQTGVVYPSGWHLQVPAAQLSLTIEPAVLEQELDVIVRYWEGAVTVTGSHMGSPVTGRGYVELAGYE